MLEIEMKNDLNREIPRRAGCFLRGMKLVSKKKYNLSDRSGQLISPISAPGLNVSRAKTLTEALLRPCTLGLYDIRQPRKGEERNKRASKMTTCLSLFGDSLKNVSVVWPWNGQRGLFPEGIEYAMRFLSSFFLVRSFQALGYIGRRKGRSYGHNNGELS